jgi:glutathione peroxidase
VAHAGARLAASGITAVGRADMAKCEAGVASDGATPIPAAMSTTPQSRRRPFGISAGHATFGVVTVHNVAIGALRGGAADLSQYRDRAILVVNVASKCGLTPQYAGLQTLYDTYADRGLVVLGVPCNQFGGQEPGTAEDIEEFCQVNYGVTFPITEKVDVNGEDRHPLYELLTRTADAADKAGDVTWNFEKFLVDGSGEVVARFRPQVAPDAPELIAAVERVLPRP